MDLLRTKVQPIGLDIGHGNIRMLQLAVESDSASSPKKADTRKLSVIAAAKHRVPESSKTDVQHRVKHAAETIRKMFMQQPFIGRKVVAALPREMVHVKNLRLPSIPEDELLAAVEFEARNLFPFDVDQARIQVLPAGEVRQGNEVRQEVIVLAVKNADADSYLQQLSAVDVEVVGLDTEVTGLFRAFERFIRRREDEQEVHVIVDIGQRQSRVIIGRGREVSFYKPLDMGGLHLLDAIARKLGITIDEARALRDRLLEAGEVPTAKKDPVRQAVYDATRSLAEDLARELAMCLRYYSVTFRGQRPARVRLVGPDAIDPQLQAIFKSTLSLPIEPARTLVNMDTSRMRATDRNGNLSEWSLAAGLSLRFVPGYFAALDGSARQIVSVEHLSTNSSTVSSLVDSLPNVPLQMEATVAGA